MRELPQKKVPGIPSAPMQRMKMHGLDASPAPVQVADLKSALSAFAQGESDAVDLSTGIELLESVRRAAEREGNLGVYTRATKLQQMFQNGVGDPDGVLTQSLFQAGQL